mgnify:CR=1 FL=1
MVLARVSCLVLLLLCAPCLAASVRVTVTAEEDGTAEARTPAANPVVFEVGKLGLPWRTVHDVRTDGQIVKWTAAKGRVYEVWDRDEFARAQLRAVGEPPERAQELGRSLTGVVLDAMRKVQRRRKSVDSDRLATAEIRLSRALCVLLGVRIDIEAGANLNVWPECDLPVEAVLTSRDTQARARFACFMKPDNWSLKSVKQGENQARARGTLRIPGRSAFYLGTYPLTACFDIEYGRVRFRATETVELELVHPFEKDASIETVSETEIDFTVRLSSLAPVRGITTELYLPDGWSGHIPVEKFDLDGERSLTYRITKPADDPDGLRIVGAIFRIGDYGTSKRLITDHAIRLAESTSVTGFKVTPSTDAPKLERAAGRSCRRMPASGRIGFDVSENFLPGNETCVTVECAADQESSVAVEYRGIDGSIRTTEAHRIEPGDRWDRYTFTIRDAVFDASVADGADFALVSQQGSPLLFGVYISRFRR